MKNSIAKKSFFTMIAIFLLASCVNPDSEKSGQRNDDSDAKTILISEWIDECSKNPVSASCDKFVQNSKLSDFLFGTNAGDSNQISIDLDGNSMTDKLGRIYCVDGICYADLIVKNYGNYPWDNSLVFSLMNKDSFFETRDKFYFSSPLNPGLTKTASLQFEVGSKIDGMLQLWARNYITDGTEGVIQLCRVSSESYLKDFPGVTYENCLRLRSYNYRNDKFEPR